MCQRGSNTHRIDTLVFVLLYRVSRVVDNVEIVACTTNHRIRTGSTIDCVVRVIPDNRVGKRVSNQGSAADAIGENQIFDGVEFRQVEIGRCIDRIRSRRVVDNSPGIIDEIRVITRSTDQRGNSNATHQCVIAIATDQRVANSITSKGHIQFAVLGVADE